MEATPTEAVPGKGASAAVAVPAAEGRSSAAAAAAAAASRFNSAAAFVESGVQEVYEDSCSICLDNFTDEEPCALTTCNHDFHLQCILEWAQRSQECPMCWQPLAMKDAESQELLAACAQERRLHAQSLSPPTFFRSAFDDYELQRRFAASYSDETDLERRILQHLAAAAGMTRARLVTGRVSSSGEQGRTQQRPPPSSPPPTSHIFGSMFGRASSSASPESSSHATRGPSQAASQFPENAAAGASAGARRSSTPPPFQGFVVGPERASPPRPSPPQSPPPAPPPDTVLLPAPARPIVRTESSPPAPPAAPPPSREEASLNRAASLDSPGSLGQLVVGPRTPPRSESSGSCKGSPAEGHGEGTSTVGDNGQSLGEAFKSRWAAASTRLTTFSKNTKSFRERLRLRGGAVADLSQRAREMGAGVVRALERISDPERPGESLAEGSAMGSSQSGGSGSTIKATAGPVRSEAEAQPAMAEEQQESTDRDRNTDTVVGEINAQSQNPDITSEARVEAGPAVEDPLDTASERASDEDGRGELKQEPSRKRSHEPVAQAPQIPAS